MKRLDSQLKTDFPLAEVTVIKLGGKALSEEKRKNILIKQIVAVGRKLPVVLVHGGGPEVTKTLEKLGIRTKFVGGLRYTDAKIMELVEMVLSGKVNKDLVSKINLFGGKAVGLSGKDGSPPLVLAKRIKMLGLVGEPKSVNTDLLEIFLKRRIIPVVASVACDLRGKSLNINADTFASAIASVLKAKRLIFLTNTPGVIGENRKPIPTIRIKEIPELIKNKIVSEGMIPKLKSSLEAIRKNVGEVIIGNGKRRLDSGTKIKN